MPWVVICIRVWAVSEDQATDVATEEKKEVNNVDFFF